MPLTFNLRHLEKRILELEGELSAEELELTDFDELIDVSQPVTYEITLERVSDGVLARGILRCTLECQCVRCLRPFPVLLELNWACDLPLTGEEAVLVVNDCIDLTPYLREDILLAFPQHPLCESGCRGLLDADSHWKEPASVAEQVSEESSAWAELNKLKF